MCLPIPLLIHQYAYLVLANIVLIVHLYWNTTLFRCIEALSRNTTLHWQTLLHAMIGTVDLILSNALY